MRDADARLGAARHRDRREVHRVRDVAVVDVVLHLVDGHHRAVVLALRRRGAEVRDRQHVFDAEQRVVREVGRVGRHAPAFERRQQRRRVDELAAREVQQAHAGLHLFKRFRADIAAGRVVQRDMYGDVVAVCEDLVERGRLRDAARKVPRRVDGEERVEAVDLHAERFGGVGDEHADRAEADDAELLAEDLGACERALALFDALRDLFAAALERFGPLDCRDDPAGGHQQRREHELLDRVGVCAGRVEHDDARLRAFLDRDVVDAGAGARDREQRLRQLHVVHRGGAHEDALGVLHLGRKFIVRAEPGGADRADLVEAEYLVHHAFSFSNFSMNSTSFSTPARGIAL